MSANVNLSNLLKLALVCLTTGGGSAAVVGRLSAQSVKAELDAHESGFHPQEAAARESLKQEFIAQAQEARQQAQQAAYDANRAAAMLEVLLRAQHLSPPPAPPRPALVVIDAGTPDAGVRDAGR